MTCIVGMLNKGKVIIGADSAGMNGVDVTIRKDPKVFITGDFVIGCTSSFRMIELLQFSLKVKPQKTEGVYEYMCTSFVTAIRKCFKKGGFLQKFADGDEKGGLFLVGYKGRLFKIGSDFQVAETLEGFDSCGCAEDYAIGSLITTRDLNKEMTVKERVYKALEVASERSGGVSPPFIILEK